MKEQAIRLEIEFIEDSDGRWDSIFGALEELLHLRETETSTVLRRDESIERFVN